MGTKTTQDCVHQLNLLEGFFLHGVSVHRQSNVDICSVCSRCYVVAMMVHLEDNVSAIFTILSYSFGGNLLLMSPYIVWILSCLSTS